jgi:hypothetical protein
MTTPISCGTLVIVVLGVVQGIFFDIVLESWRALRRDRRDILAAIGTVVAIDEIDGARRYGPAMS